MNHILILGEYQELGGWFDQCLISLSEQMSKGSCLHVIDCSSIDRLKLEEALSASLPDLDSELDIDYIPCLGTYDIASVIKDLQEGAQYCISSIVVSPPECRHHIPRDTEYNTIVDVPEDERLIPECENPDVIDRAVHFFWSGPDFPYVNRLAVETALEAHNPGRLFMWYYEEPDSEHWEYIQNLGGVDTASVEDIYGEEHFEDFNEYFEEVSPKLADHRTHAYEAQMKDYFMWHILADYGGVFLDMDTISYRPVWDQLDDLAPGELALHGSRRVGATGLLAYRKALPDSQGVHKDIIGKLYMSMTEVLQGEDEGLNEWNYWTLLGPTLLRRVVSEVENASDSIVELPGEQCYPWVSDADYVFTEGVEEGDLDDIKVLHYYQSGRREMGCRVKPEDIDEGYIQSVDSPFSRIVQDVLYGETREGSSAGGGDGSITIDKSDVKKDPENPLVTASMVIGDPPLDKLRRCLESAEPVVDQFIFACNGENDETVDLIEEIMGDVDMPPIGEDSPASYGYKIYDAEWKGYLKSRNEALELAEQHMVESEYILKLDPDEYIVGSRNLRAMVMATNPDVLDTFCYGESRFKFHRLWHKYTCARYVGRYHEIPMFSNASNIVLMEPGLSEDDDPFEGDSGTGAYVIHDSEENSEGKEQLGNALLRQDIIETTRTDKVIPRQYFYAGRDIMRAGRLEESEYWFEERLRIWDKDTDPRLVERYFTLLYLGHNLRDQDRDEEAAAAYAKATGLYPEAREGWYYLIKVMQDEPDFVEDTLDMLVVLLRGAIAADKVPSDMPMFVQTNLYTSEVTNNMAIELADVVMSIDSSPETASMVYPTLLGLEGIDEEQEEEIEERRESLKEVVVAGYKDLLPERVESLKN